jgi:SAM-dependent methyltransferase
MDDRKLPDSRLALAMKFTAMEPPRAFLVGHDQKIELKDCARIALQPDEQVTFVTESGTEYDVVRKTWGYYATPSLNRRLREFKLKTALVRSDERLYILLVEDGKENDFHAYLQDQEMEVVYWLDQALRHSGTQSQRLPDSELPDSELCTIQTPNCFLCGSTAYAFVFRYDAPPAGETLFPLTANERYYREIWQCHGCGLFVNRHQMSSADLYEGNYVDATYGADKILSTFQKIITLPPERSDNYHRVKRIVRYMAEKRTVDRRQNAEDGLPTADGRRPTVLDVGSGLCVFLQRMKEEGWECTALDPDPRTVEHAQRHIGVHAICDDFLAAPQLSAYDLITFNKVLEHVEDPITVLQKSHQHLRRGGVVYVEVPDGEAAAVEGAGREEFFIEHLWAFSLTSLISLATRAGFSVHCIERVHEPSRKYTLRAFLHSAEA